MGGTDAQQANQLTPIGNDVVGTADTIRGDGEPRPFRGRWRRHIWTKPRTQWHEHSSYLYEPDRRGVGHGADKHLSARRVCRSIDPLTSFSPGGKRRLRRRVVWPVADIDLPDPVQSVVNDLGCRVKSVHDVPYGRLRGRPADDRLGRVTGETQVHDRDEGGKHSDSSGGDAEQTLVPGLWASVISYTTREKIVMEWEYMDMAHVMRQLGVIPAAATA